MKKNCIVCDKKQVDKVCNILSVTEEQKKELDKKVDTYFEHMDMSKTNPEVMGEVYTIITSFLHNENPYEEIKKYFNEEVGKLIPDIRKLIQQSDDRLMTALRIAIGGNLIDFAAKHTFDMEVLKKKVNELATGALNIDDSRIMFDQIAHAKNLLYLGDNCGEIALDKLFIEELKLAFPDLSVYYGVRGIPIVNDVTMDDARQVGMEQVAHVIDNGDGSLGTVLHKTCKEFQQIYAIADVIISKGQGNYESLLDEEKDQIYFLYMAKCENVSVPLEIPLMSIVCMKKRPGLTW